MVVFRQSVNYYVSGKAWNKDTHSSVHPLSPMPQKGRIWFLSTCCEPYAMSTKQIGSPVSLQRCWHLAPFPTNTLVLAQLSLHADAHYVHLCA